jgi:hypothetical protein
MKQKQNPAVLRTCTAAAHAAEASAENARTAAESAELHAKDAHEYYLMTYTTLARARRTFRRHSLIYIVTSIILLIAALYV